MSRKIKDSSLRVTKDGSTYYINSCQVNDSRRKLQCIPKKGITYERRQIMKIDLMRHKFKHLLKPPGFSRVNLPEETEPEVDTSLFTKAEDSAKKIEDSEKKRISNKILADLIGTKYYLQNEDIRFDRAEIVLVFDENDKNLGQMTFGDAERDAKSLGMDILLRNAKVTPPIVKIMNYRVELMKRLIKKLNKNKEVVGQVYNKSKTIFFSSEMSDGDLSHRKDKLTKILHQYTKVKLCVPIRNPADLDEIAKVENMINNLSFDFSSQAEMLFDPVVEEKAEMATLSQDELKEKLQLIDMLGLEAKDTSPIVFTEFDSLVADRRGIDYQKLADSITFDDFKAENSQKLIDKINRTREEDRKVKKTLKKKKIFSEYGDLKDKVGKVDEKLDLSYKEILDELDVNSFENKDAFVLNAVNTRLLREELFVQEKIAALKEEAEFVDEAFCNFARGELEGEEGDISKYA